MSVSKSAALKQAYAAYGEAHKRICEPWNYQRYLEHKAELDTAHDAAVVARDEWRASGEAWPFPRFFSKTTRWVVEPSD